LKKLFFFTALSFWAISSHAQQYPEMIKAEGGSFEMGDEQGVGKANEQPVHTVTLKTFTIARTETTVLQWKTYCSATGRKMLYPPKWGWIDDHPMVNVSWDDAVAYCDWMSDKTGKIYRLPTEAEWEYAARGGKSGKGYKFSGSQSLDMAGWYEDNSGESARSVAQKRPNELGLYDMSGNAWEWCKDWYGADYYATSPATNPRGPASGTRRVLRGGGWGYTAADCRVANRNGFTPAGRAGDFGFRVVVPE
jgi:formylglycine-generating enzyme